MPDVRDIGHYVLINTRPRVPFVHLTKILQNSWSTNV